MSQQRSESQGTRNVELNIFKSSPFSILEIFQKITFLRNQKSIFFKKYSLSPERSNFKWTFQSGVCLPVGFRPYTASCENLVPSGGRTTLYEFNFSFEILFLVIQTVFSIEPFFDLENVELTIPLTWINYWHEIIIVYVNGHFYDLRIEPKILILLIR